MVGVIMRISNFLRIAIVGVFLLSFSFAGPSAKAINFQGYLTDKNGQSVFGTRLMSFVLCSDSAGTPIGAAALANIDSRTVTIYNGNYSTKLDLTNAQFAQMNADPINGTIWLKVVVDGVPMVPLIQMVAVPFAGNVRGLDIGSDNRVSFNINTLTGGTISGATITGGTLAPMSISTPGTIHAGGAIDGLSLSFDGGKIFTNGTDGWIRVIDQTVNDGGSAGLYFQPNAANTTGEGGIYMDDKTTVKVYGSKDFSTIGTGIIKNAIWNDLAEVRILAKNEKKLPGKVYVTTKDGIRLATKRCEIGTIGVCSDSFGFLLGGDKNEKGKAPIAISGWVLAYVDKDYPLGTALTSGPNGDLTAMTKKEKMEYPERIVGILDTKPDKYNNVKVDGRYWVKVK